MRTDHIHPEHQAVHDAWRQQRTASPTAELIIGAAVTVLAGALGVIVGQWVLALGWGLRPAVLVGLLAAVACWMIIAVLAAAMLSAQLSSRERGE